MSDSNDAWLEQCALLPETIEWVGDEYGWLRLLDQTVLPGSTSFLECSAPEEVWQAIRQLSVRGAPAIGIAAAYGAVLSAQGTSDPIAAVRRAVKLLATSRPTAVNLFWALERVERIVDRYEQACLGRDSQGDLGTDIAPKSPNADESLLALLLSEAKSIHDEDRELCRRIGNYGAPLIANCSGVLTHCNAGSLATSQFGTALAVIYAAQKTNPRLRVFADETRPLLQGARLTAWELQKAGVDVTVICDSMAAHVMRQGFVQAVVVGADRIAANGDTANKIGTYSVAISAKHHGIPFYVAAPHSTFDLAISDGSAIPIEERSAEEISHPNGAQASILPTDVAVYNPAFDVTPADLITAIITDRGVVTNPRRETIEGIVGKV